ncbi:hypothetical protein C9J48_04900 [Photobacterium profundum]|uniref:Uncharacterized protein n=1 Tax=Photobacterium profundum 3TCK TaxID=314280 RepID=Q1YYW0_9GAMM|nr:hypothetical protein [Photobacterium profundum]EAS41448.1 hypothetical protein P3TCK_06712 [Photobacterium profundum 3TCK]PSV62853.1 hypothetical protein C9J48_04900 [Photobacterium profundum]
MNKITNKIIVLFVTSLIGIAFFSFNLFVLKDDIKGLYDYKRIFVCFLLIVMSIHVLLHHEFRYKIIHQFNSLSQKVKVLFVIFFSSAAIANLFGLYFYRAQEDYFYFIGLMLFCAVISMVCYQGRTRIFIYFTLISYLLFFSVILGHWVAVAYDIELSFHSIISFANPRMLNQVQSWIIIPVMYFTIIAIRQSKTYILAILPLALNFAIIIALDGRGIAVSSITAILLWAWFDKSLRKMILSVFFHSLIAGFIIKLALLSPLPEYLVLGISPDAWTNIRTTDAGRLAVWIEALQMVSFLGHGGDAFICNSTTFGRPHNSILLILVNWGVISAISYSLLLLYAFKTIYLTKHRLIRVSGLSMLSGFAYSLVSGVVDSPLSQLTGAISIALFWASCQHFKRCEVNNVAITRITEKHFILILCSVLTIGLVGNKVYQRIDNNHYRGMPIGKTQFWVGQNCIDEEALLMK